MAQTRRCWGRKNGRRANSRKNSSRKQRGGAATDGGYGMPQQYYNPSMFSTRTESDATSMSSAPTSDSVRPTMFATTPANYDAINGVGAVPRAMVGGRRSQAGGYYPVTGQFLSGAMMSASPVGSPMRGGRRSKRSQKKKTRTNRK